MEFMFEADAASAVQGVACARAVAGSVVRAVPDPFWWHSHLMNSSCEVSLDEFVAL